MSQPAFTHNQRLLHTDSLDGCLQFRVAASPAVGQKLHLALCADLRDRLCVLRPSRSGKSPGGRCTTNQSDELAPLHSITSSARARSAGGTVRPKALAVFRLIAS